MRRRKRVQEGSSLGLGGITRNEILRFESFATLTYMQWAGKGECVLN